MLSIFSFYNEPATTEIYTYGHTLSLHDALPISERPAHLLRIQPDGAADRRRRAEHAGGAGDVPAAVVVIRIDGIADAALHLDADDQRGQQLAARQRADLRQRQQRRGDRPGRVDAGLQVGVVVVEPVRGDAVEDDR